jgi:alcohol dehydrogenase (cytochrome c)
VRQLSGVNVGLLTAPWTVLTDLSPAILTGRSGGLGVPLALDGVLYFAGNNNRVWAIDGRTGRQIWQYTRDMPADVASRTTRAITRGLAVLGNKLFLGTLDAHVITLDIKTGKVVWDTVMGDYTKFYTVTSAPLIVGDKVVVGISGADRGALRFFIDAYDVETGSDSGGSTRLPNPESRARRRGRARRRCRGGRRAWTIPAALTPR